MKILLLLLIPFSLFGQIQITEGITMSIIRLPDTIHNESSEIEYVNDWVHMTNKGSYPSGDNSKLIFTFKGTGLQIFTEIYDGHKYYDISIDGNKQRVILNDGVNVLDSMTFHLQDLENIEHVVEMEGPIYGFVLNRALIEHPQLSQPCVPDTVFVHDTTYLKPDTVRYYYKPVLKEDLFDYELIEDH